MFDELLAMFNGRFDDYTFLVKVYPVSENLDKIHKVPDNYSISRISQSDMTMYADTTKWFYYKNLSSVANSAEFTLIFKRSELLMLPPFSMSDFLGVVAYNTNETVLRSVTPNPINWLRMTGEPFSQN